MMARLAGNVNFRPALVGRAVLTHILGGWRNRNKWLRVRVTAGDAITRAGAEMRRLVRAERSRTMPSWRGEDG